MDSINFGAPFQLLRPSGAEATPYALPYDILGALAQMQPYPQPPSLVADH
jgi:hypothetical protein